MSIRMLSRIAFAVTLVFTLAAPALAEVVTTITLDDIAATVGCDEPWQENLVDMWFTATTPEDCDGGGHCDFGIGVGDLWLYPSRLVVDLDGTYAVTQIEIDWTDYCGQGCTQAFAYDGEAEVANVGNASVYSPETALLVPAGGQADRIIVASCLAGISEIRITADVVAARSENWGTIKALYR